MHSMGIHSALAIKRQRKRRDEAKKSRERRYSIQSSESGDTLHSPRSSIRRKIRHNQHHQPTFQDTKVVTSIGMLHIGVVFLVFGVFLVGAGLIPDDATATTAWSIFEADSWWNELVCTGLFAVGLGIFLIILNSVISKKEEEDLETYVARQLTRSRSGHRLERDVETGGLQTKHHRRAKESERNNVERGLDSQSHHNLVVTTPTSSEMVTPTSPLGGIGIGTSGDMLLEKILEEEASIVDERSDTLSPMTMDRDDKRFLLGNGHSGSMHVTHI